MKKNKKITGEKWKQIEFDFKFTNDIYLEISDYGKLRTSNQVSDERILKGTKINGYIAHHLKLFKPRTLKTSLELKKLKNNISELNKEIKTNKKNYKKLKLNKRGLLKLKVEEHKKAVICNEFKKAYRKLFNSDLKKRTVAWSVLSHRLVASFFCKKKSIDHNLVIHIDHNKTNNYFKNLKWVTQEGATKHWQTSPRVKREYRRRKGRVFANSKQNKLDARKVLNIRKQMARGKSLRKMAEKYKVSETQIARIRDRINWKNIP